MLLSFLNAKMPRYKAWDMIYNFFLSEIREVQAINGAGSYIGYHSRLVRLVDSIQEMNGFVLGWYFKEEETRKRLGWSEKKYYVDLEPVTRTTPGYAGQIITFKMRKR